MDALGRIADAARRDPRRGRGPRPGRQLERAQVRDVRRRRLLQLLLEQEPAGRRGRHDRHRRRRPRRAAAAAALARDDDADVGSPSRPRPQLRRRHARASTTGSTRSGPRSGSSSSAGSRTRTRGRAEVSSALPRGAARDRRDHDAVPGSGCAEAVVSPPRRRRSCPRASTGSPSASALHEQRIQTSVHYPPIHQFTAYEELGGRRHAAAHRRRRRPRRHAAPLRRR